MQHALERARTLVALYDDEVAALLPNGAELFDVHVHVGTDIDGFVSRVDDLLAFLGKDGVTRAFAFCLDEPDREPAFRAANDRTLEAARPSKRRPAPLMRARAESSFTLGRSGSSSTTHALHPSSRSRQSGASRSSSTGAAGSRPSPSTSATSSTRIRRRS